MNTEQLKALFDEVKEIREGDKTLPYLEKDLLNVIILQNSKIIALLEKMNESI